ncbi:MAG: ATP-binding protein, partial [Archangium sp.]
GPDGGVEGVFVQAVEVSELVRARQRAEALAEQERLARAEAEEALTLLDTLLTNAPVGMAILDRELRYVRINQLLADFNGLSIAQTLGRTPYEVIPTLAPFLVPICRRVMEEGVPLIDHEVAGPTSARTGETRYWLLSYYPVRNRAGEVLLVGAVVLDITASKRAEQAQALFIEAGTLLSQSLDVATTLKSLASLVVRHLSDYCMVDLLGEDGQFLRLEVSAGDSERQELIRRTMPYAPRLRAGGAFARALETGAPVVVPEITPGWLDAVAVDSVHRAVLEELAPRAAVIVPLVARGRKLGVINLAWRQPLSSASLQVEVERARGVADRAAVALDNARLYQEAQEAIRMREDVVAIVSHDLRSPLNAITLSTTLLLKREDVDERTAKAASRIFSAADRATRMIRDLLDFTRARVSGIPIQPRPLDFHELVRRVVDEVSLAWPERRIALRASGAGGGEWDEDRLAQVVTNLVGNALQHSPASTPVRVSTRGEDGGVTLEVHNEGAPIPAALRPKLFEPYRRGEEAGEDRGSLGLGLFITRQIVLGHGGTIDVRSTGEEGSTFTVRLPRRLGA